MVRAERRLEVSENSLEHPPETAGVPSVQKDRVESSPGTSFSVWCFISSSWRSTTAFVIDSEGKTLLVFEAVGVGVFETFFSPAMGLRVRFGEEGIDSDGESGNSEGETALEVSRE